MQSSKMICDSLSPRGLRISSMLVTFPRFILAELNTHRMLTKSSASSRAIPFERMLKMVVENPFIPIAWQKDHKGMQGSEYFIEVSGDKIGTEYDDIYHAKEEWLTARDYAVIQAKQLNKQGVTKQLCNRLLEPFMRHTVLITATEYDNFFELRCPRYQNKCRIYKSKKDALMDSDGGLKILIEENGDIHWLKINAGQAEIHMMALAESMWDCMKESTPKQLKEGEWHIPFGDSIDGQRIIDMFGSKSYVERYSKAKTGNMFYSYYDIQTAIIRIATARCARTSYLNFEGNDDYEADIALHDRLVVSKPQHSSPAEHCARVMTEKEYFSFYRGEAQSIEHDVNEWVELNDTTDSDNFGWCRNFRGFIQYRHLLESGGKI